MKRLTVFATSALTAVVMGVGLLVVPAASAATTFIKNPDVAYFTVNNGKSPSNAFTGDAFCRYKTPQSAVSLNPTGKASASPGGGSGPAKLSINGVTSGAYADDGFYALIGTIGHLAGYTITATGPFGDNLWFDVNKDGEFFSWDSSGCLDGAGSPTADVFSFGPPSVSDGSGGYTLEVTGDTHFNVCGGTFTLSDLAAGTTCIPADTPVALWVGIGTFLSSSSTSFNSNITSTSYTTTD